MGVFIPDKDIQAARDVSLMDFLRQNRPAMYSNITRVGSQYVVKARYFGTKVMNFGSTYTKRRCKFGPKCKSYEFSTAEPAGDVLEHCPGWIPVCGEGEVLRDKRGILLFPDPRF